MALATATSDLDAPRTITILGSTGSIGVNTVDLIQRDREALEERIGLRLVLDQSKSFDHAKTIHVEKSLDKGTQNSWEWHMRFPHWCSLLITGLLAILVRPTPRFRFTLRDLFAFTTIVAVVAGSFAALLRVAES